jgi:hypothetical protein
MTDAQKIVDQPGRSCPLHYRYAPQVFNRPAEIHAETIYVIGGLYGNPLALETIFDIAQRETVKPTLIFNGDFNWFNIDATWKLSSTTLTRARDAAVRILKMYRTPKLNIRIASWATCKPLPPSFPTSRNALPRSRCISSHK